MRRLALLALGCFVGSLAADDKKKTDEEAIMGTWKIQKYDAAGQKALPAAYQKMRIIFEKDGKLKRISANGDTEDGTWKIDADAKPKTIDLTSSDEKFEKGVYELNGDTLKLATVWGAPGDGLARPTQFKADGKRLIVYYLQRVKDKNK
jgi:uncharacterized protein (TIGR03067 family)